MTLPGPEATHRWQGRTLVDRNGERVGSIERIYTDKVTDQPEWALLRPGAGGPAAAFVFVPLVSATEEGDTVRTPFDKALVERAPSVPAGVEISEDQEAELYRHYGVPYSRAESPSGLPAGQPRPASPQGAGGTAELPASEPAMTAPPVPAPEPSPAGLDATPSRAARDGGAAARTTPRIQDPRVAAAAGGAALAVAAGIWQRKLIGRQLSAAASGLAGLPGSFSRRRRQRLRAESFDQAVVAAASGAAAVARATSRLLVAVSLLPVAGAVQAGRRVWAGVQAARQDVRKRGRRARPGSRTARRAAKFAVVVPGAAAVSRLVAIPRAAQRRRRQRRRAKAAKRSVTRGAGQAALLASIAGRLLAWAALMPVTSVVRGGRRAWAGVQLTRPAAGKRGGRLRRGSRRGRRGGTLGAVVGGAAGYVLGARAGEERYQEIARTAKRLTERPELKRARDQAMVKLDQLSGRAADKLQQSRRPAVAETTSGPSQPVTAADAPPERLP